MKGYYFYVDDREISRSVEKVVVKFIEDMQILELYQDLNNIHTVCLPKSKTWRTSAKIEFI